MKRYPNRSMLVAEEERKPGRNRRCKLKHQPRRRVIWPTPLRRFRWSACRPLASGPCSLPAAAPASSTCPDCKRSSTTSAAAEPDVIGVVMDDEDARAVVQTGTGSKIRRVRIGDDIDGWKVSQD